MGDTTKINQLIQRYPQLPALLKSGYFRKYQVSDSLKVSKAEADLVVQELLTEQVVKMTPFGLKMLKRTQDELAGRGVVI